MSKTGWVRERRYNDLRNKTRRDRRAARKVVDGLLSDVSELRRSLDFQNDLAGGHIKRLNAEIDMHVREKSEALEKRSAEHRLEMLEMTEAVTKIKEERSNMEGEVERCWQALGMLGALVPDGAWITSYDPRVIASAIYESVTAQLRASKPGAYTRVMV